MALISCSECGHKVSDKAAACPSCGNPLGDSVAEPVLSGRRSRSAQLATQVPVQTVEQTGKKYKGAMLAGGLGMVFGLLLVMGDADVPGALLLTGGLICYIYGRFGAWWHHA